MKKSQNILCKIPDQTKLFVGITGHLFSLPLMYYFAAKSPVLSVFEAIILTMMGFVGALFLAAIAMPEHAAMTGEKWMKQSNGMWLFKSAGILLFLVIALIIQNVK